MVLQARTRMTVVLDANLHSLKREGKGEKTQLPHLCKHNAGGWVSKGFTLVLEASLHRLRSAGVRSGAMLSRWVWKRLKPE